MRLWDVATARPLSPPLWHPGPTYAVAFSAVQMSTGELADVEGIMAAAAAVDAITICDATQALGWLPLG